MRYLLAAIIAALLTAAHAAVAQQPACSVALVLLMDTSGSVDMDEYVAQRDGTAKALRSPEVVRLIETQPGGIAVTAIEWGWSARTTVPWALLKTASDVQAFSSHIEATERDDRGGTYMGAALDAAARALETAPCVAEREVVDVSGDGEADDEFESSMKVLKERGTVVNVLAVPEPKKPWLPDWFREHIVTPGGFLMEADGYAAYGPAIRRKLILELAAN